MYLDSGLPTDICRDYDTDNAPLAEILSVKSSEAAFQRVDDRVLNQMQKASFGYFLHEFNPVNGLIRDKTAADSPCSIAAVGMALTVIPIGVERGFVTRADAARGTLTMLRFFADSEQSQSATATGYKGFYYHFLDMETGRRVWRSELSSLDTGILIAGVLTAGQYFTHAGKAETEIRALSDLLYRRVDWQWMCAGNAALCLGWRPERGFLPWHYTGYNEALFLYLLGLGSPTFPLPTAAYDAWLSTYKWRRIYGIEYLHAGPLFIHQLSHMWVDFRGIRDAFMAARDCDYFENSRRATLVQQAYAIRNPRRLAGLHAFCWGTTACDGPGPALRKAAGRKRRFFDYTPRGVPYGPDDGTIAPWAAVASLPFAPEIVLPTIAHFRTLKLHEANPYGFKASFNPSFPTDKSHPAGWVSPWHFGINEGPTVIMIENYRSGFLWDLMRDCPAFRTGLNRAGFQAVA